MALLLCCGARRARAQEMEVPVAIQLPLFLKVLSFDRQLPARAGSSLVIAIAYQSGFRASEQVKDDLLRAADAPGALTQLSDFAIHFVSVDLDREELSEAVERCGATVLYLAPVRGVDVKEMAMMARAAQVTTMTGVPRYVEEGLAVSARLRGDRPQILVNLSAARSEGAQFAAELLKLAQVL